MLDLGGQRLGCLAERVQQGGNIDPRQFLGGRGRRGHLALRSLYLHRFQLLECFLPSDTLGTPLGMRLHEARHKLGILGAHHSLADQLLENRLRGLLATRGCCCLLGLLLLLGQLLPQFRQLRRLGHRLSHSLGGAGRLAFDGLLQFSYACLQVSNLLLYRRRRQSFHLSVEGCLVLG